MQLVHTGYTSIQAGSDNFFHVTRQIRFPMLKRGLAYATLTAYHERRAPQGAVYIGLASYTTVSRLGTETTIDVKWPDPPFVENLTAVTFYIACTPKIW